MSNTNIYRRQAIEKLSSPEQLDKMIKITSLSTYIAVIAAGVLFSVFGIWAVKGKVPFTYSGIGIYLDGGSFEDIYSEVNGEVTACNYMEGESFEAGDVLYEVRTDEGVTKIKAYEDGKVYDVYADKGHFTNVGGRLLKFRSKENEGALLYCYVPLRYGRQIEEGMGIIACPTYLDINDYGNMTGRVISVSEEAVTVHQMESTIGSDVIVESMLNSREPLLCIKCELNTDPSSGNGYYWTRKAGRTVKLHDETDLSVQFILREQSPLNILWKK